METRRLIAMNIVHARNTECNCTICEAENHNRLHAKIIILVNNEKEKVYFAETRGKCECVECITC